MWIDITPLRRNKDFRYLFTSQVVSFLGTMMTYVAIPVQVYELTQSSKMVGIVSAVQLVPLVVFGLFGGSIADRFDRRKLLIGSEFLMAICALVLTINSFFPSPSLYLIIIGSFFLQAFSAFHRPAMDALSQNIVSREDYAAMGALGSLRSSIGAIAGPAVGGLMTAQWGAQSVYLFDTVSFLLAAFLISRMSKDLRVMEKDSHESLQHMWEGVRYACRNPVLLGTYFVDMIAMAFAFPVAIFPAMALTFGSTEYAGHLYAAMAFGSLLMTAFSGWTKTFAWKGRGVIFAAMAWAVGIFGLAFAPNLWVALACLAIAGCFDMLSGLFRGIIWNEIIPNDMRGRMAGIEMISYMSGPLIGGARAGWMADKYGITYALAYGAVLAVVVVFVLGYGIRAFWNYRSHDGAHEVAVRV